MIKKILTGIAAIALLQGEVAYAQQALAPDFFSQNGWMPDTIGGGTPYNAANCPGLAFTPSIPCICNGTLQQHWGKIKDSRARFIRYGGIGVDQNIPNRNHYLKFVDSVRARGMEPILQIPLNLGNDGTDDYDTIDAKAIINYINGTMGRNVTYWSIGNEPDHALPGGYGYDSAYQAIQITTYIKNFSKAMRRAVPAVPIKIMGPELAEWNCDAGYTKKKLVDSLLTPNQRCDITGGDATTGQAWIDYFSFHWYGTNGDAPSLPRATMIAKLRSDNNLAETLDTLNVKLAAANSYHSRTGSLALKSAITEAHIAYQNDSLDAFTDVKCNGFFAGQYWAELASIAAEKSVSILSYWSTVENSMGYMKFNGTKKSTYWHFKEMAKWFNGTYYTGTDNQTNIKAFGTKNGDYIAVMVLNQDQDTITNPPKPYTIHLDSSTVGSTWISMNMGASKAYVDTIDASSSTLLVFDLYGNISQKYYYKQSEGSSQPGFHQRYNLCSNTGTFASQGALDDYGPAHYQHIVLGDASGVNSVTVDRNSPHFNNSIYRATTSITLEKNFFSGNVGQTLDLIIDTDCQ